MKPFRLRSDLRRAVIDGFALPLGIAPGEIKAPLQGYTVAYTPGIEDEPDTYSFYVAVSHERVGPLVRRAFELLPQSLCAIVEISSRDAYRLVDVYLSDEEIPIGRFRDTWGRWQEILLEDGSIGAGANSESPFIEVFLDQWKGLSIIIPLDMRDEVEAMLDQLGLEEVPQTWPVGDDNPELDRVQIRPVLEDGETTGVDIDDVLFQLRHDWRLELNVDPDTNVDDVGRQLGMTLWHAVVGVESESGPDGQTEIADMSIWATAGSLGELETLIDNVLNSNAEWRFAEVYSTDRVAFDERPETLADLAPRRQQAETHLVSIERRSPSHGVDS